MIVIKLQEAIDIAKENGITVKKMDLAKKLWPKSKNFTQKANFAKLCNGKTIRVTVDMIKIICKELSCDANFLFDIIGDPIALENKSVRLEIKRTGDKYIANVINN